MHMNTLALIGNTPMFQAVDLDTGPCELFLKMENRNPGGSIKDRIALSMIAAAEEDGSLKPGGTIIEATAGNTGLGLALVARTKGYRLVLVIPDKMSREKIAQLRALGAEVVLTRSDVAKGHPEYYQDVAARLTQETPGAWFVNQFANPNNARAHREGTGPEIYRQMEGRLDAVVVGVGSGGTLGGLTEYFLEADPSVEIVIADPKGSIVAPYVRSGSFGEAGSWLVEGIGEDFIPINCRFDLTKHAYEISDAESFAAARELLATNGVLGGSSTGTLLAAALKYCREQVMPKRVVSFVCDSGERYISKMYNDQWMQDQGFMPRSTHGDLRDLISRPHDQHATVVMAPSEKLRSAYTRMKMFDVSQLPVVQDGKVVGLLDETDLLLAMSRDPDAMQHEVRDHMTARLQVLHPHDSLDKAVELLNQGLTAIVADQQTFYGIVTRIDVIDYLRRKAMPV